MPFKLFSYCLLYLLSFSALAQVEGTEFKKALISKKAELHYFYSEGPGFTELSHGRMVGICVDIMADFEFFLLDKYGIYVDVIHHNETYLDLPSFFEKVKNSKYSVFGVSNITLTEERQEKYHFSPPFIRNYAVLITNDQVAELNDLDSIAFEFAGMKAITVPGTTNHQQILSIKEKYYPTLEIEFLNNFDTLMQVVNEHTDYFSTVDMAYLISAHKKSFHIKDHPAAIQKADELAILLPYETDWDIALRKFLTKEYLNSMSYRKIITKHLGWECLVWLDEMNALYGALE